MSEDGWDSHVPTKRGHPPNRAPERVPDDWDEEDEDEGAELNEAEHNQKIWREADCKPAAPIPSLVPSSNAPLIPIAALEPKMRILKRPKNAPGSDRAEKQASVPTETIQDREARYQAARDRIFGQTGRDTTANEAKHGAHDGREALTTKTAGIEGGREKS